MDTSIESCAFEIIIGTYEQFLLGYNFKLDSQELVESFATHSHQASIRCITATNTYVASGGSDEIIQLYNMVTRKCIGSIMEHTGTVTSLKFTPESSHLLSCSLDGSIAVYRVGSWQLEKLWSAAHKGAGVSCIDVHPSNKLALSLGQNRTLRTWNLVKGRPAYTTNLSSLGQYMDTVTWSVRGTYFAVIVDNKIHVFNVNIAGIVATIDCTSRITCASFFQDDILCFGEENGSIVCYSVSSNSQLWTLEVGDSRIKCLCSVLSKWLVSACSNGQVIVWEMPDTSILPNQLASVNVNCRVTCMDVRIPAKIEE